MCQWAKSMTQKTMPFGKITHVFLESPTGNWWLTTKFQSQQLIWKRQNCTKNEVMKLKGDESKVIVESFESYQTFSQDWDTFFTFCYLSVVRGQAVPIRSRGAIRRDGMVLRTVSQTPWLCLPNQDRWLTLTAVPPACQAHGLIRSLLLSVISSFVLQISVKPILRVRHGSRGWEYSGIGQKGPRLWQRHPGEERARKQVN